MFIFDVRVIFACVGSAIGLLLAFGPDTAAAPTILICLTLSLVLHSVVLTFWRRSG
ncbi:hypothetical protein KKG66_06095 [bacterium]|nr:hypothetical protein [bacterium]